MRFVRECLFTLWCLLRLKSPDAERSKRAQRWAAEGAEQAYRENLKS